MHIKCGFEEQLLTLTKENELHLNEAFVSLRKVTLSLDDYLKKFKGLRDKLSADDLTKVMHLARGICIKYKPFKTAMLSKAPCH